MTVINPFVESLKAYVPGEQPKDNDVIKLNTNESPYMPAPAVLKAVREEAGLALFNKYPDPTCANLRMAVAEKLGVTPEEIVCGNGSDETLRMLFHAFTTPSDTLAVCSPTYVLYETLAQMHGVKVENHPVAAPDYSLPESFIEASARILCLPNPNPPLGTFYELSDLECLAAADPERLVVIDEAYVDFAPNDAMSVYRKYDNVVISRTFSKSYSLAGVRIGFAILKPKLAQALGKIKDSYNVNRLTQAAALAAWNSADYYGKMVGTIKQDREYLKSELTARGFQVPESHGNFVFARRANAKKLYQELKDRKILVRYFDTPELNDGLRITVGTRDELNSLLSALDEILS